MRDEPTLDRMLEWLDHSDIRFFVDIQHTHLHVIRSEYTVRVITE